MGHFMALWDMDVNTFRQFHKNLTGLPLAIHLKIPWLFSDFSLTFYIFPYPLSDKKKTIIFIIYLNGTNCITSNLGVTLLGKNLLPKGANSFP